MRVKFSVVALLFASAIFSVAQTNPVKLTATARFDLSAGSSVGSLDGGVLLQGGGSAGRQTWRPATEQPRTYTVSLNVVHFAWNEFVFRFVPAANGTVTLSLMGPWEPSPSGPIFRQEVLWDAVSATNAVVNNGSFESVGGNGVPTGWSRPFGDATTLPGPVAPVEGQRYLRTWHDGPLSCSLSVTAGLPVTVRLHARAAIPAGYEEMRRITATNTPAHLAARRFMRGVNLGNYLEAPPGQNWGATYAASDFDNIRQEGFDHVRLPIAWHHHTGPAPEFTLAPAIFDKADFLVTNALTRGLNVIVNIHHFDDLTSNPAAHVERFYAIWRQLAAHYRDAPEGLALELLNEPRDAATTEVMNPIYAEAIRQIRQIDSNRTIFLGPGRYNSLDEVGSLRLPDDDENLIVTLHSYDPFLFTHQGASWTMPSTATKGIVYPGPPPTPLAPAAGTPAGSVDWINRYNTEPGESNPSNRRAFEGRLKLVKQWSSHYGRPVHIGEFGCYEQAPLESRIRFYLEMRESMDRLGLGWAMWDWKAGFKYWDGPRDAPVPGIRDAIFPKPRLQIKGNIRLEVEGAVAKRYRLERALSLNGQPDWSELMSELLVEPRLIFTDPAADENSQAFYRVLWLK